MWIYNFSIKGKFSKTQLILPAIVLLLQGINQTMQKMYAVYIPNKDAADYTFFSFIFTVLSLFIVRIFIKTKEEKQSYIFLLNNMMYITAMSCSLFGSSFFQAAAANSIDAIILYPLMNALSLIAGSTMASMFFVRN